MRLRSCVWIWPTSLYYFRSLTSRLIKSWRCATLDLWFLTVWWLLYTDCNTHIWSTTAVCDLSVIFWRTNVMTHGWTVIFFNRIILFKFQLARQINNVETSWALGATFQCIESLRKHGTCWKHRHSQRCNTPQPTKALTGFNSLGKNIYIDCICHFVIELILKMWVFIHTSALTLWMFLIRMLSYVWG